jgi:hypothetical protein
VADACGADLIRTRRDGELGRAAEMVREHSIRHWPVVEATRWLSLIRPRGHSPSAAGTAPVSPSHIIRAVGVGEASPLTRAGTRVMPWRTHCGMGSFLPSGRDGAFTVFVFTVTRSPGTQW